MMTTIYTFFGCFLLFELFRLSYYGCSFHFSRSRDPTTVGICILCSMILILVTFAVYIYHGVIVVLTGMVSFAFYFTLHGRYLGIHKVKYTTLHILNLFLESQL